MTTYHHDPRSNCLRRLAFRIALSLFGLTAFPAFAALEYSYTGGGIAGPWNSSASAACAAWGAAFNAANSATVTVVTGMVSGSTTCDYTPTYHPSGSPGSVGHISPTTREASVCTAGPAGFHRGVVAGEKVNPFNTCMANCVTSAIPRLDLGVSVTTGTPVSTYATWELVRKAESCDSATSTLPSLPSTGTTPTAPAPEAECPAGQRRVYFASGTPTCAPIPEDRFCPTGYTYGTINGKDTCISQSSGPPTASSPTTTDKTPSTETKESSTTVTNPDGTTTKTTTTSNGKGGGTTTTTTTSADGKTIESVTKKMGDDPEGKCADGTLGCMRPGTPGGDGPVKSERTVVLGTGVGLSGFSAECPADKVYQVAGGFEVRLTYSKACELAPWIKPLVLLAASIIAGYIVIETLRS